ncbi:HAD-IB family phosphatase [Ructibacterium gallinarum]|uniref:HAD-IB family phosphatase n=1 Tax=Ructibacterium gallinarum TaxID=2779355 RepID=A0A9D5M4W3_9FIRM|nr:HAD-IB family phosphatase [Ructibacterium gallinarum]MBE5039589.1 HAD-IB family phosphatase [Ructibacterium gallinarum]
MNVYDFDKTIYDGDSTIDFVFWCLRRKPQLAVRLLRGTVAFGGYLLKLCSKTTFKEKFYCFLLSVPDVNNWLEEFWDEHQEKIKNWYLQQKQETDVIISASPEFLLRPICKRLHVQNLLASRVDRHTGMYMGVNCYGEEKVRRFKKMFDGPVDAFYSDSLSDAPMANLAKRAYLVDGDNLIAWEE